MSTLFWLSFFFSHSPNAHACEVRGTPLLEIKQGSEVDSTTTTRRIYNTGAWTFESDNATARGCFSRTELTSIRRALAQATWKVTSSQIACFAYDPNFTEYTLNGRLRYTHRLCSGKTADAATLDAIHFVEQELANDLPPPPPAPKPPVDSCRATGTPIFEIRKRSEAKEPTSTVAIYSTGAWTFQPIDASGRAGALTTGCFDKPTLRSIRSAVTDSPWTVTRNEIVCMAYSASFTEYYVNGKYEYTARMCGEQRLDATSAAAITKIDAALAKVLPKQTR
ncbi:MAG: hypothetical protein HOV81_12110 [Kofleriaceae bacterium]|nr:hypothetical protein [Kofleriaceae bacterium]